MKEAGLLQESPCISGELLRAEQDSLDCHTVTDNKCHLADISGGKIKNKFYPYVSQIFLDFSFLQRRTRGRDSSGDAALVPKMPQPDLLTSTGQHCTR